MRVTAPNEAGRPRVKAGPKADQRNELSVLELARADEAVERERNAGARDVSRAPEGADHTRVIHAQELDGGGEDPLVRLVKYEVVDVRDRDTGLNGQVPEIPGTFREATSGDVEKLIARGFWPSSTEMTAAPAPSPNRTHVARSSQSRARWLASIARSSRVSSVQIRRSLIPVRVKIHSSEVSRKSDRSSLVTTRLGRADPVPRIHSPPMA